MPSIIRTFVAVPQDVREWTRFLDKLFFNGTVTLTLTGATGAPSGDAKYTVSAGVVVLDVPAMSGVSVSTSATLTTLPERIRPKTAKVVVARVTDNSVTSFGLFSIGTDGVITLYVNASSATFTAAGAKGIAACCVAYSLD